MKTLGRGAHAAKWILAFLFTSRFAAGRTRLSEARGRTRPDSRHRSGHRRRRRAARRRRLSRTPQQLHSAVSTGAGLGYSYGFPLALEGSAPSLFNINAQSALLNPALRDFVRAAKVDSAVASLKTKDQRNQIIRMLH